MSVIIRLTTTCIANLLSSNSRAENAFDFFKEFSPDKSGTGNLWREYDSQCGCFYLVRNKRNCRWLFDFSPSYFSSKMRPNFDTNKLGIFPFSFILAFCRQEFHQYLWCFVWSRVDIEFLKSIPRWWMMFLFALQDIGFFFFVKRKTSRYERSKTNYLCSRWTFHKSS